MNSVFVTGLLNGFTLVTSRRQPINASPSTVYRSRSMPMAIDLYDTIDCIRCSTYPRGLHLGSDSRRVLRPHRTQHNDRQNVSLVISRRNEGLPNTPHGMYTPDHGSILRRAEVSYLSSRSRSRVHLPLHSR